MVILDISFPHFTWNLWLDVWQMFQYEFMRNAFLAGTALSIVSGLVGYFVLVRHQAFAGEALSDVAFTGAVGGVVLGINPLAGMIVLTILGALAMGSFALRIGERDIAVGTVLAWVLGLGVLFLSLLTNHVSGSIGFSGVTVLFGSILSISTSQTMDNCRSSCGHRAGAAGCRQTVALRIVGPRRGISARRSCAVAGTWSSWCSWR